MSKFDDMSDSQIVWWWIVRIGGCTLFLVLAFMFGLPQYSVYQQNLEGEAELARATQNRQIAIQEAQAKKEAAHDLAAAEIIRAEGVAKANQIIGESLKANEAYLRYLWIDNMDKTQNQIIYIPTEAGLPILEANRFNKSSEVGQLEQKQK